MGFQPYKSGKKGYSFNSYNHEPRIQLIDKDGNLILVISQLQAFQLLRNGFCELLMVKPPTLQFQLDRSEWDTNFLSLPKKKTFKIGRDFRDKTGNYLEARKSVLYGNYRIQSPEGNEMFHCSAKKALWYLNRDIVDIVTDSPPTLRLKFTPGGPGHTGDEYYLTGKVNRCVVCGCENNLNRHHVVPSIFRRYLPEEIKDHNYHDVLLTCIDCHETYEAHANKFKQQICHELGCTINLGGPKYIKEIGVAVSTAHALLRYSDKIPEPRLSTLRNIIKEYLKKDEITQADLEDVATHYAWQITEEHKTYGEFVMSRIGDIQEFTERWRDHFIETMKPKYLPDYWDVKKPLTRMRDKKKNATEKLSCETII